MKKYQIFAGCVFLIASATLWAQENVGTPQVGESLNAESAAQSAETANAPAAVTSNASDANAQSNVSTRDKGGKQQNADRKKEAKEKRKKDTAEKGENAEKNKKEKKQQEKKSREKKNEQNVGKFTSDLDVKSLGGNMKDAFKTRPEFRNIVQEEIALERKSRELARQIKQEKNPKKKSAMETELREVVAGHFDVRQTRRLYELNFFEERIQELRMQIETRNEKKDRIVEKRLTDLIGTDEDLRF